MFWDQRIPPGESFGRYIQRRIDSAACVVVLWSNSSVESEWVENEAAWAQRTPKLIPALLDSVEEKIPIQFSQLEAADLTDWHGEASNAEFQLLCDAITAKAKRSQIQQTQVEPELKPTDDSTTLHRAIRENWPAIGTGILFLAVAVFVGSIFIARPEFAEEEPTTASTRPIDTRLDLQIDPPDATVELVDATEDTTWQFRNRGTLPIGEHRIKVSKIGFETTIANVSIGPAMNIVRVTLEPALARLFVNTDPADAKVTISAENSTIVQEYDRNTPLPQGNYNLEVSRAGFETKSINAHLQNNSLLVGVSLDPRDPASNEAGRRSTFVMPDFTGAHAGAVVYTDAGELRSAIAYKNADGSKVDVFDTGQLSLSIPLGSMPAALSFFYGGEGLAVAMGDSPTYQLWNLTDKSLVGTVESAHSENGNLVHNDKSGLYASADRATRVRLAQTDDGDLLNEFSCGEVPLNGPESAFSGDGKQLAIVCHNTIRLYEADTGKLFRTFEMSECCYFTALALSPDGNRVAGGMGDGRVESWDVGSGKAGLVYGRYIGGGAGPYTAAFSPDGLTLVMGYSRGSMDLWEVATGKKRGALIGHTLGIIAIAFNADGTELATAATDGSIRVWALDQT